MSRCASSVPTVLLVAPALDDRTMYAEYLRAANWRVVEIDDTADALALAITADVVVTDIRVHGPFDGVELVRLRTNEPTQDTPIIVLTAYVFESDEQRARAAGCDAFLPKPCCSEALLAEIRRLQEVRRAHAHE